MDDNPIVVTSSSQLASAVSSSSTYDVVYLGDNIQIPIGGITIGANKTSLIIDGYYNGITHTLTEANSISLVDTIGVRTASSINLTFRNMIIVGRNYYGTPYVAEGTAMSGVSVTYENVTYSGPQITFNPNGLTRYIDCEITISQSGGVYPEEVGEVCKVEFEGRTTIQHNSSGLLSVFWFRGDSNAAYFKVLKDARLTITTANYFMFCRTTKLLPLLNRPVEFVIQEGASFVLDSDHGFSYDENHRVASFLVCKNAEFRYIQRNRNNSFASMYVNESFTVNEGADFSMLADFDNSAPLINFADGVSGLSLRVNNPKSFVLYNKAAPPITLTSPNTRSFILNGAQINHWETATAFIDGAGGFDDEPRYKWYRPDWSAFSISGSISSGQTDVTDTSLTPYEQQLVPDITDLKFETARVLSVGNLPIAMDSIVDDGRPISGTTLPDASIIVSFNPGDTDYVFSITAEADGSFLLDPSMLIPEGTAVTIKANTPFLITEILKYAVPLVEVMIIYAPIRITYRFPPVSTVPVPLLTRNNPEDPVKVYDSREYPSEWKLYASISGPLETQSGEVLNNSVVFKGDDGIIQELGDTPIEVFTGGTISGPTFVSWPEDKGILVRVTEPLHSGMEYTTNVIWDLEVT